MERQAVASPKRGLVRTKPAPMLANWTHMLVVRIDKSVVIGTPSELMSTLATFKDPTVKTMAPSAPGCCAPTYTTNKDGDITFQFMLGGPVPASTIELLSGCNTMFVRVPVTIMARMLAVCTCILNQMQNLTVIFHLIRDFRDTRISETDNLCELALAMNATVFGLHHNMTIDILSDHASYDRICIALLSSVSPGPSTESRSRTMPHPVKLRREPYYVPRYHNSVTKPKTSSPLGNSEPLSF